jgi:hypothetical protein
MGHQLLAKNNQSELTQEKAPLVPIYGGAFIELAKSNFAEFEVRNVNLYRF